MVKAAATGLASALALAGGLWLFEQLRNPISDMRLWIASTVDRVKGEVR